jgi:hypothetical protein
VGIGLASLLPIFISPNFFFLTFLLAFAIGIFGFVKGCLRASSEGNFVSFDYLEFLGPVRWLLVLGFFGLYVCGFLTLWVVAQISCAFAKPRAMLPWFGVQAFGFVLVVLAMITAAISNRIWQQVRPIQQPGTQAVSGPGPAGPQDKKKEQPQPEPEPPAVTGDRDTDRSLARIGGKNGDLLRTAADQLAGMQPNQHRAVVAKKLADAVSTADAVNRPPLLKALGTWGTAAEVPVIVRFMGEGDTNTRNAALQAAGKVRDERAVEPAIRCLESIHTTWHAEDALKKMGPVAEKDLLAALNQPGNKDIRHPILRILKETGTEKSIPTLEEASRGDFAIKGAAQATLDAVRKRTGK